jgi:predicted lipoprotein
MNTIGAQAKSIAALEYLLFMEGISATNTAFVASQKRRNYLKLSAAYVKSRGNVLLNVWASDGQDYAALFIQNAGSGIDDSANLFYNGIHNILDVTKTTKVGKPAGLENSQVVNPVLTQAYLSDTSLDLIKASIESAEEAYFGNGLGIDDYIFSIADNTQLNDAIQNKINEVYSAINALNRPFDQAITENQSQIATLHNHLEALRVLIAVDVQSIMSISITSTDTDGD